MLKNISGKNYSDIEDRLKTSLPQTFEHHECLLQSDKLRQEDKTLIQKCLSEEVKTQQVKNA